MQWKLIFFSVSVKERSKEKPAPSYACLVSADIGILPLPESLHLQKWGPISCVLVGFVKYVYTYLSLYIFQLFCLRKAVVKALIYSQNCLKFQMKCSKSVLKGRSERVAVYAQSFWKHQDWTLCYFINSVNPVKIPFYLLYIHCLAVNNCITEDALCVFWKSRLGFSRKGLVSAVLFDFWWVQ